MKKMKLSTALLLAALAMPALAQDADHLSEPESQPQIDLGQVDHETSREMTPEERERWGINELVEKIEQQWIGQVQREAEPREYVRAPFLGVNAKPLDIETAEKLGLKRSTGLLVTYAPGNAPAGVAGLKKGDVLTKLNDQILVNAEQFAVLVRSQAIGDTVTLHGLRDGEPIKLEAKLGEADVLLLGPGGSELEREWRFKINPVHGPIGSPLRPEVEIAPGLWIGDGRGNHVQGGIDHEALPDEVKKMIENFQTQMRQQRQEMDQMLQQLDLNIDDLQGQFDGQPGRASASASATMFDGEHEIQLVSKDGDRQLTIKDKNGKVIFDGPMPENGQVPGLDKSIQEKVDKLMVNSQIEINKTPAPADAPPAT